METRIKTVVALLSLVLIASLAGVSLYQGYAGRIEEQARLAYEQEMKEALAKVRAEITRQTLELECMKSNV